MDISGRADDTPSGSNVAVPCHNDGTGTSLQFQKNPSTMTSQTDGQYLQDDIATDSAHGMSPILKTHSDSDETNESSSLPSKSSSTIDSLGSTEKDDRLVSTSNRTKKSKRKKDRSKLRKGKWTVSSEYQSIFNEIQTSSYLKFLLQYHSSKKKSIHLALFIILVLVS